MSNLKEALYRCIENEVTCTSSNNSYWVMLFSASTSKFSMELNMSISFPGNDDAGKLGLTVVNGDTYYKDYGFLDSNYIESVALYKKISNNVTYIFLVITKVPTAGGSPILTIRKNVNYGEFDNLLSASTASTSGGTTFCTILPTDPQRSQTTILNTDENGVAYIYKLQGYTDTNHTLSAISNFSSISADQITANVCYNFNERSSGITDSQIRINGPYTYQNGLSESVSYLPIAIEYKNTHKLITDYAEHLATREKLTEMELNCEGSGDHKELLLFRSYGVAGMEEYYTKAQILITGDTTTEFTTHGVHDSDIWLKLMSFKGFYISESTLIQTDVGNSTSIHKLFNLRNKVKVKVTNTSGSVITNSPADIVLEFDERTNELKITYTLVS